MTEISKPRKMSEEDKRRSGDNCDVNADSDNIEVAEVVQQDAVFGELTEGGPNYRSVSHTNLLLRRGSKHRPDSFFSL